MIRAAITADKVRWLLPVLTAFTLDTGRWDECGSFQVEFPWDLSGCAALERAAELTLLDDGQTVFTGVVDEVEMELGKAGRRCRVCGRSLAARLLDNQAPGGEFSPAQLEEILRRYVTPFGIQTVQADALPPVPGFLAETGSSCWQVLAGFCRHSAEVRPHVAADGTLILRRNPVGKQIVLTESCGYTELNRRIQRYGRISRQLLTDAVTGVVSAWDNAAFLAEGGQCQQVTTRSGSLTRAGWRTAQQRIADGERDRDVLRITVPGGFLAEPGDTAQVQLKGLALAGTHRVRWARTVLDENGLRCCLELGPEL